MCHYVASTLIISFAIALARETTAQQNAALAAQTKAESAQLELFREHQARELLEKNRETKVANYMGLLYKQSCLY